MVLTILVTLLLPACDAASTEPQAEAPAAIVMSVAELDLSSGDTVRIEAALIGKSGRPIASPSAGQSKGGHPVTWSTTNAEVAAVDGDGLVLGKRAGDATITAKSGSLQGNARVKVRGPKPKTSVAKVTVSPKADTLDAIGHTVQLTVRVLDEQGNEVSNPSVSWSSLDPSIAIVGGKGEVTSKATGKTRVTATSDGVTDTSVVVSRQLVASVAASPATVSIEAAETAQLSAVALDANGVAVAGAAIAWASANPSVATVSASGLVTGMAAGSVAITASSGGKSGTVSVTVTAAATPPPPSDSPDFGAIVRGIRPRGFGQGSYALLQPAQGAKMYYVSPSGSDSNAGTSSAPFRTINKAAQVAVAGDVVTIRTGTYRESVSVKNAGTTDKRIVFQAEERGQVVLTGGTHHFVPAGWHSGMMQSGPVFVTVRGLIFREYGTLTPLNSRTQAAVGAIRGWRIEDCLFDKAGYHGLDIRGDNVEVLRSTFQYHHTNALTAYAPSGSALKGIRITDVVLRWNHTRSDPLAGAQSTKVMKFYRTQGAVVDNLESYENNGPGWWFDTDNTHFVVRNSYIHGNRTSSGRGIFVEINWAPGLIENNVLANNLQAGIDLANSQGVTVRANLFVGNDRCIALVNANRGAAYPLKDIVIEGNFCKGWAGASAIHPGGANITSAEQMNIRANGNVYDPGSKRELTYWSNTGWIRTIAEMQSKLAWEKEGRIEAIPWPR